MTTSLAAAPDLEQIKKQAKELLRAFHAHSPNAAQRFRDSHPELGKIALERLADLPLQLSDAQLVVAREYGFPSWPRLKNEVDRRTAGKGYRMSKTVLTTEIPGLNKFITGKVRDVYDLGDTLLIVVCDRLSAFDVVLPTGIPDKGRVLTQLSRFWFEQTQSIVPNHMLSTDISEIAGAIEKAGGSVNDDVKKMLEGRSMLVKKAQALPVECVARGYISGSLWKDYKAVVSHGGEIHVLGLSLPAGLRESDKLPSPIFTPATKAQTGHDENIPFETVVEMLGEKTAGALRDYTLGLYASASNFARERGIIIADAKFEFGVLNGQIILIDEALTPDSSRFWDAKTYQPVNSQPSFDKQFVRDYLETLDWGKTYPGPELPPAIAEKTAEKYREAYQHITSHPLQ